MGVRARTEVYGLFSACMPQASRSNAEQMPLRKRQGLVPDFMFHLALDGPERGLLFELKTLHYGRSTYDAGPGRCDAVARRAGALPAEYSGKARRLDRTYCGTAAGSQGPVESKLRSYDPVRGLVFGAWGEGSPAVDRLIGLFAECGAGRHYRRMQARSPHEAKGALAWLLRRRWAITALRENARLKLERLEFVGPGAASAAARQAAASQGRACLLRRAPCRLASGSRLSTWQSDW